MRSTKIYAGILSALIAAGVFTGCTDNNELSETELNTSAALEEISENTVPEKNAAEEIVFSHKSGFYKDNFQLEIASNDSKAKIYYTTDGSVPSEASNLYSQPIELKNRSSEPNVLSAQTGISVGERYVPREKVTKANVIRAVAVHEDGSKSEIINCNRFWFC